MVTRILLIRHGQTDWNLQGRYQGHSDIDINSEGRRQARKLSTRLQGEKLDAVYSSDRVRAINTAKIIFKEHNVRAEAGLREICFGVFEGLTHDEILKMYPDTYSKWAKNLFGARITKGEGPSVFKKRVLKAFKKIISVNKGKAIAIVTHGGPINALIGNILGTSHKDFMPALTSLSIIEIEKGRIRVILLNDTAHLWVR